jgi:hypothetical protein
MRIGEVNRSERLPPEVVSRLLRWRHFYSIENAGLKIGLSRTQAYVAARAGIIPTERYGKLLLVRRAVWDRKVKQLLRGPRSRHKLTRAETARQVT